MLTDATDCMTKEREFSAPLAMKTKLALQPESDYAVGIGGTILSSKSTLQQIQLPKGENFGSGPAVCSTVRVCDVDIREDLHSNCVSSRGTTMLTDTGDCTTKEEMISAPSTERWSSFLDDEKVGLIENDTVRGFEHYEIINDGHEARLIVYTFC